MWIYLTCKHSISSVELEEFPKLSINGVQQNITVKSTPIVKECYSHEWQVEISTTLQFGTTSKPSMERSWGLSTLSSVASRNCVKIFQLQDMEQAWKESEADCFSRSCAWPKKSSPDSYSLKTYQLLQHEGDFKSLERLPKWGMIVGGVLYPQHPLEQDIKENDGSCWPTPRSCNAMNTAFSQHLAIRNKGNLEEEVCKVTLSVATPRASQASKPIKVPSPSCQNGTHGENLADSIGRLNPEMIGKRLSIAFVEVLMGYCINWTECEPLVTQLCLSKSKKPLKC